jgi:hypothetical protein
MTVGQEDGIDSGQAMPRKDVDSAAIEVFAAVD